MVARRTCAYRYPDGHPCGSPPLADGAQCFMHDPDRQAEATEARRLGGLRRRREATLSGAYDFAGLTSVGAIRRILEIATLDTLGLENSLGRARTLIAAAQAATKLLETGELEERIKTLESAVLHRHIARERSPFDSDEDGSEPFLAERETS